MAVYSTEGGFLIVRNASARFLSGPSSKLPRLDVPRPRSAAIPLPSTNSEAHDRPPGQADSQRRRPSAVLSDFASYQTIISLPRKSLIRSI